MTASTSTWMGVMPTLVLAQPQPSQAQPQPSHSPATAKPQPSHSQATAKPQPSHSPATAKPQPSHSPPMIPAPVDDSVHQHLDGVLVRQQVDDVEGVGHDAHLEGQGVGGEGRSGGKG
jgi:hypothetical protein